MANIPLKSIKFPDLDDTYTVPSNAGELPYNKSATYPADTVGKALQDKPDADGTIANAEQLTSNIYEEDNTPYNFRTSGGSIDIGDRETDMLVGGSVAWNQLVQNGNFADGTTGWSGSNATIASYDGGIKVTPTANYGGAKTVVSYIAGHKYLHIAQAKGENGGEFFALNNSNGINKQLGTLTTSKAWYSSIESALETAERSVAWWTQQQSQVFTLYTAMVFDLTAMFGSTIADYIYSLEQATAGAGVAWFRKLFPKPYYAYNAGELMHVSGVSSHDMVGFNQMNPESYIIGTGSHYNVDAGDTLSSGGGSSRATTSGINPITVSVNTGWAGVTYISEPLVKGNTYKLACSFTASTASNIRATAYIINDSNTVVERMGNYSNASTISAMTYTPTEAGLHFAIFIGSTSTQNVTVTDLCCHLVWDGERNGEYEEYVKHSYPLDSSLTLRGIPKLDASNNLYYDGDTYESDGTVTRKYAVVDLGTLTWNRVSVSGASHYFFYAELSGGSRADDFSGINPKYPMKTGANWYTVDETSRLYGSVSYGFSRVAIRDDTYTDEASFKTAMSGVYLVYELATPTTETADPYTNPQIVDDFGTEEYVDYAVSQGDRDVAIPVGHETQYMANLKAKLEMSPNSPEGAGDYIVRQTNGENEYVSLASNATIQDIIARLEALENAES